MADEFDPAALDPEEVQSIAAQLPVMNAAWAFLRPVADGDLDAAWPHVDPLLRRCWSQYWLHANRHQLRADGYDREQVLAEFERETPEHDLWHHFVRVQLWSLHESLSGLDPAHWGIGTAARPHAPDVELLYLHDTSDLPGGVWQPDTARHVYPLLMHYADDRWRLINFGTADVLPEPGWPPRL